MTMRAHNNQIAMTLLGDSHNGASRVSLGEKIFDRCSRSDRWGCALKLFPQPIAIPFRLELMCHFAKRHVARAERFHDVSNDHERLELGRQIGGNPERAFRAIGKVGRVQDGLRSEHSEFTEKDRVGMPHERN